MTKVVSNFTSIICFLAFLISQDVYKQLSSVWEEDRWVLDKMIQRKSLGTKHGQQLGDVILANFSELAPSDENLLPSSILLSSKDYRIKRRLGSGKEYKEIQWRGGSFLMRQFHGDIEEVNPEISQGLSLSHPNIMHYFCGFVDDQKKEFFLVMELMTRDLSSYIKEIYGAKQRVPFTLPAAVDIMMQIARGMEYMQKCQDSDHLLQLVRHLQLSRIRTRLSRSSFEDSHLQGDKTSRNIRAGERPLFPFQFQIPKYLTNLIRRCWHADPNQRPSFSSICRILRYVKRFLLLNPVHNPDSPLPAPMVDYCETETTLLKKFPSWGDNKVFPLSQIPFQMFAYRVAEKERSKASHTETTESGSEEVPFNGDDNSVVDDFIPKRMSFLPEAPPGLQSSNNLLDAYNPILERKNFPLPESAPRRRSMTTKKLTQIDDTLSKRKSINPETARTLGSQGRWIVISHIGWEGERSMPYNRMWIPSLQDAFWGQSTADPIRTLQISVLLRHLFYLLDNAEPCFFSGGLAKGSCLKMKFRARIVPPTPPTKAAGPVSRLHFLYIILLPLPLLFKKQDSNLRSLELSEGCKSTV